VESKQEVIASVYTLMKKEAAAGFTDNSECFIVCSCVRERERELLKERQMKIIVHGVSSVFTMAHKEFR
jgi:gluconate kinase